MLNFYSASVRMVNSQRAIIECLESAMEEDNAYDDCRLILVYAGLGHDYEVIVEESKKRCPNAKIFGGSGCGIVGTEGVSESLKDCAIMAICGPENEMATASATEVYGDTAYQKAVEMAKALETQQPTINMIFLFGPGIDTACDQLIEGIETIFGKNIPIFGATSSDAMQGIVNYQILDGLITEHGAFIVGFADPTLSVITQATHGFFALGEPMTVTRSTGHKIHELDGKPAWQVYTERLGLTPDVAPGDTISVGALAEPLSEEDARAYRNPHILRVMTKKAEDGTIYYPCYCPEGTQLWLTTRDEKAIFRDLDAMLQDMTTLAENRMPVAVFHADCLARGRALFGQIFKDEIVARMQAPFMKSGPIPWLGIYGFGEFAKLNGKNRFHNYTTALYVIYRQTAGEN